MFVDAEILLQEIIEFPVVMVDAQTMEPVSTFHKYVQPRVNRDLTPFCTQLTGIIQDMVDDQPHFEEVLGLFNQWLIDKGKCKPERRPLSVVVAVPPPPLLYSAWTHPICISF